jgi:hypothetical protein
LLALPGFMAMPVDGVFSFFSLQMQHGFGLQIDTLPLRLHNLATKQLYFYCLQI